MKITGKKIYLSTLEREHCKTLWNDYEYDFDNITEPLSIGNSIEKADEWFEEILKDQGSKHVRLGIFKSDNEVVGDIALQDIDWKNRSCSIGLSIPKLGNRNSGYGLEATTLLKNYAFNNLGLERISANTLEQNIGAQKCLEKAGFELEGRERKAIYLAGEKWDRLRYGLLNTAAL